MSTNLNRSVPNLDVKCFRTESDVVVLMALSNVAIAVFAALLPQYAFVSWMASVLYYHVAVRLLEPLCEWRKYYYVVFVASIVVSLAAYIYALDAAAKYAESGDRIIFGRKVSPVEYTAWMAIQYMTIFFTALIALPAQIFALKRLRPSKNDPPNKYPQLPTSGSRFGRLVEMMGTTNDVCSLNEPHSELQRLICRGDMSVVDKLPEYVLIVATYYAMFRRRDLNLAGNLLQVLKSRYLFPDEEDAVKVLDAAYKALNTCDVRPICDIVAIDWASLFKELVVLHFAYDKKAAERLKCKAVKAFTRYEIYDIRRGWYIEYAPDPLLYFIHHAVDYVKPVCQPQT